MSNSSHPTSLVTFAAFFCLKSLAIPYNQGIAYALDRVSDDRIQSLVNRLAFSFNTSIHSSCPHSRGPKCQALYFVTPWAAPPPSIPLFFYYVCPTRCLIKEGSLCEPFVSLTPPYECPITLCKTVFSWINRSQWYLHVTHSACSSDRWELCFLCLMVGHHLILRITYINHCILEWLLLSSGSRQCFGFSSFYKKFCNVGVHLGELLFSRFFCCVHMAFKLTKGTGQYRPLQLCGS